MLDKACVLAAESERVLIEPNYYKVGFGFELDSMNDDSVNANIRVGIPPKVRVQLRCCEKKEAMTP